MPTRLSFQQTYTTSDNQLLYPQAWRPILEIDNNPVSKPTLNVFFSITPLITHEIDFLFEFTSYTDMKGIIKNTLTRILYYLSPIHTPAYRVEFGTLFTSKLYSNTKLLPTVLIDTCEYSKQYKQLALIVARKHLSQLLQSCPDECLDDLQQYLATEEAIIIRPNSTDSCITTPPRLDTQSSETVSSEENLASEVIPISKPSPDMETTAASEITPPMPANKKKSKKKRKSSQQSQSETTSSIAELTPPPQATQVIEPAAVPHALAIKNKISKKQPKQKQIQQQTLAPVTWGDWITTQRAKFHISDETKHKMLVFSTLVPLNWVTAYGLEASGVIDRQELWDDARSRITPQAGLAAITMTALSAFYVYKASHKLKAKMQ